jgi:Coenzyme PQQ synthesis protein D (PqqD)
VQGLRENPTQFIFKPMRVEKSTLTVFTALDDGTGVLLNLATLFYYSLNRTGVALWEELERRNPSTLDDLVRATCGRFDVDEDAARQHIAAFVGQLEELRMVRIL